MKQKIIIVSAVFVLMGLLPGTVDALSPSVPNISESIKKQIEEAQGGINNLNLPALGDPVVAPYFDLRNPEDAEILAPEDLLFQWSAVKPTDDLLAYYVLTLKKIEAPGVTSDVFSVRAEKSVHAFTPDPLAQGSYQWFMTAMKADDTVFYKTPQRTFTIVIPTVGTPPVDPSAEPPTAPATEPAAPASDSASDTTPTATGTDQPTTNPTAPVPAGSTDTTQKGTNALQDTVQNDTDPATGLTKVKDSSARESTDVDKNDEQRNNNLLQYLHLVLLGLGGLLFLVHRLSSSNSKHENTTTDEDVTSSSPDHADEPSPQTPEDTATQEQSERQ